MILCRCGRSNDEDAASCADCGSLLALSAAADPPTIEAEPLTLRSEAAPAELLDEAADPTALSPSRPQAPAEALRCVACGSVLQPSWRFCKGCGSAVGAAADAVRARHALARMSKDGQAQLPQGLREGRTVLGREEGDLTFPTDGTLSARHAAFVVAGASCEVVDLGSTNGTFVSIRGEEAIEPGDVVLIGVSRLLYRRSSRGFELVEMLPEGEEGRRLRLAGPRALLGKDASADLSFPEDGHVSRRHAEIVRAPSGHVLRDLGSTNRTYRIVTSRRTLRDGDRVVAGAQVFEYRRLG